MMRVAAIAVFHKDGRLLMGLRRDSGKWCCPGGKSEEGESPMETAIREMAEETDLSPDGVLKPLGSETITKGNTEIKIWAYRCTATGTPSNRLDPDEEVLFWKWVDVSNGLPDKIARNLHNRRDVVLRFIGLQRDSDDRVNKSEPMGEEPMVKSKLAAAATGLVLGMIGGKASAIPEKPPITAPAPTQESQSAPEQHTHQHPAGSWSAEGLYPGLRPIAHLESSWGKNVDHVPSPKGEFHTAYGALGFKPMTAHDEYKRQKSLQMLYPGLDEPDTFMERFKGDSKFYNAVASTHWQRLKRLLGGDSGKAAFAWRWGLGAAQAADDQTISDDDYVHKYRALREKLGIDHMLAAAKPQRHEDLELHERERFLAKAIMRNDLGVKQPKVWRSSDVSIPSADHPRRAQYDKSYHQALTDYYSHSQLVPETFQVAELDPQNLPVNKDRYNLYSRMARAGDRLPPILVDDRGKVVDGSHRVHAARDAGVKELPGYRLGMRLKPMAKMAFDPEPVKENMAQAQDILHGSKLVPHNQEIDEHPAEVEPVAQLYKQSMDHSKIQYDAQPIKQGGSKKSIAYLPAGKFLLKPYHESNGGTNKNGDWEDDYWEGSQPHLIQGWAEMTNQALYHAGGIGDLHQQVFVHDHPKMKDHPLVVVHMDPDVKNDVENMESDPELAEDNQAKYDMSDQAAKITLMDFLSHNTDRHQYNVLYGKRNGKYTLMAIDHGRSFQYQMPFPNTADSLPLHKVLHDWAWNESAKSGITPTRNSSFGKAIAWWREKGPAITKEFDRRLQMIQDPERRNHLEMNFYARRNVLDRLADPENSKGWAKNPHIAYYLPNIRHAVGGGGPYDPHRMGEHIMESVAPHYLWGEQKRWPHVAERLKGVG